MKESVSGCPLEEAMRILGGRWRIVLVYYLLDGPMRFSDLRRAMPNISQRMLTLDLRALEKAGLVTRTIYPAVPPTVSRVADVANACAYVSASDGVAAARWQQFGLLLDEVARRPGADERIVRGATQAFVRMRDWFHRAPTD